MPVMGPEYSKSKADQAYEEVLKLLREKYYIQNCEPLGLFPGESQKLREKVNSKLKYVIHKMFEYQSWEDF